MMKLLYVVQVHFTKDILYISRRPKAQRNAAGPTTITAPQFSSVTIFPGARSVDLPDVHPNGVQKHKVKAEPQ